MRSARIIALLAALTITLLLALQANAPAFAKQTSGAAVPECRGINLMAKLKKTDPKAHKLVLAQEAATPNGRGLLWKIERDGIAASYLFGTMHMSDQRITSLPAAVKNAFDMAKTVALELDESVLDKSKMEAEVVKNLPLIAFMDGRTLDSVLSKQDVDLLKKTLAKYKMPYFSVRMMKPWFVSLTLALPLCEMTRQAAGMQALDATLALASKERGIKQIGLETVGEQFTAFADLPLKDQKLLLISALKMNDSLDDQIETTKQLYLQRRPAAIWEFTAHLTRTTAEKDKLEQELAALNRFQNDLIHKRNKTMAERALPLLKSGNLFIGVGALHLPGENGIVSLLQKAGYKLTLVY